MIDKLLNLLRFKAVRIATFPVAFPFLVLLYAFNAGMTHGEQSGFRDFLKFCASYVCARHERPRNAAR